MSHNARAIFLFLTIVAVMFASAVGTTNVYADDGTPPPPPTEETAAVDPPTGEAEPAATEPAVAEPVATETPVTEPEVAEPVATEPAVAEPVATEPVATEPAEVAPVVEEQQPAEAETEVETILEQVPDDTTVTVLNADGEAQPLTSEESADAIIEGDPIWCPEWQDPTPGANGCTESFSSFDALLDYLAEHEGEEAYQQSGKIYVQMGVYAGPETSIDFNSYGFDSLNNYDLTVQGGWDTSGTNIVADNPTELKVPIVIGTSENPWVGSLSFDGIKITNANQTGITLYSEQNIKLTNVEVTGSQAGASLNAGGNVQVQNSKFNNNKKYGANINAGGYAYVMNSEFNNNADVEDEAEGFGLQIDNQGEVFVDSVSANFNENGANINSTGLVTVANSFFNGNIAVYKDCVWISAKQKSCHWQCTETTTGGYGLKIVSTYVNPDPDYATVYVTDVTANENYLFGAHIEAADAEIYNSTFNGSDAKPQGYGLEVLTTGAGENGVKLDNISASNNEQFGANITAVAKVTINNSFFDGNTSIKETCTWISAKQKSCHWECTDEYTGYGLQVVTTGNVNLADVSAQDNYEFGAHLEGKNVSIADSFFSGNASDSTSILTGRGLEVVSTFDTTLYNVQANNNQQFGAHIEAGNDVNITLSTFSGHVVYTYSGDCTDADKGKTCDTPQPCVKTAVGGGYGLEVIATGTSSDINLSGVTASDNYLFGIHLVATNVKIAGNGSTSTSAERNKEGIKIEAQGMVLIDSLVASNNTLSGATILAGLDETLDGSVFITNSFFSGNASYTSSYCKGKTYSGYGLRVITTGDDISLSDVEANDNYLYGAYLEGGSINVSNSLFNSNGTDNKSDHVGSGLQIVSTGTSEVVNLNNVQANNNQLFGADVKAQGYVSVTDSVFTGNQSYYTDCGKSSGSSSGGSSSGGKGGKTCQNCTTTYDGYGLKIVTSGNIYLGNVEANENYLFGAHLEGANVTIDDSTFSGNVSPTEKGKTPTGRGLEVISTGNTTLWNVEANNNQLFGADIQAGGNVVVSTSFFNNNKYYICTVCGTKSAGYGLKVNATGTIYLGPTTDYAVSAGNEASGNGAEGAILNGETTVEVVDSLFNNNGANGLTVTANDDVTLTNVEATGNKGNGAEVTGVCTNTVHVDGGKYAQNSKYGLKVVNATYDEVSAPTFSGNGSGNLFQNSSTCVSDDGGDDDGGSDSGGGSNGGGNSGGNNGWNWYWWWFWHHGFGHR